MNVHGLIWKIFDHLIAWYRYNAEELVSARRRLRVISTLICSKCPGEYLVVGIGRSCPTPEVCVKGDVRLWKHVPNAVCKLMMKYQSIG